MAQILAQGVPNLGLEYTSTCPGIVGTKHPSLECRMDSTLCGGPGLFQDII